MVRLLFVVFLALQSGHSQKLSPAVSVDPSVYCGCGAPITFMVSGFDSHGDFVDIDIEGPVSLQIYVKPDAAGSAVASYPEGIAFPAGSDVPFESPPPHCRRRRIGRCRSQSPRRPTADCTYAVGATQTVHRKFLSAPVVTLTVD
jgi:hypothetical protein